jgi:hypothetical protein
MSFGAVYLAIHPCGKPQGILAKANKKGVAFDAQPLKISLGGKGQNL